MKFLVALMVLGFSQVVYGQNVPNHSFENYSGSNISPWYYSSPSNTGWKKTSSQAKDGTYSVEWSRSRVGGNIVDDIDTFISGPFTLSAGSYRAEGFIKVDLDDPEIRNEYSNPYGRDWGVNFQVVCGSNSEGEFPKISNSCSNPRQRGASGSSGWRKYSKNFGISGTRTCRIHVHMWNPIYCDDGSEILEEHVGGKAWVDKIRVLAN